MNHDAAAGVYAKLSCALPVNFVWIRNVKRPIKSAVLIAAVDLVEPLRMLNVTCYPSFPVGAFSSTRFAFRVS